MDNTLIDPDLPLTTIVQFSEFAKEIHQMSSGTCCFAEMIQFMSTHLQQTLEATREKISDLLAFCNSVDLSLHSSASGSCDAPRLKPRLGFKCFRHDSQSWPTVQIRSYDKFSELRMLWEFAEFLMLTPPLCLALAQFTARLVLVYVYQEVGAERFIGIPWNQILSILLDHGTIPAKYVVYMHSICADVDHNLCGYVYPKCYKGHNRQAQFHLQIATSTLLYADCPFLLDYKSLWVAASWGNVGANTKNTTE